MNPSDCNNCLNWPLRELIFFPPGGGPPPVAGCFITQEDTSLIERENGSGFLLLEVCP